MTEAMRPPLRLRAVSIASLTLVSEVMSSLMVSSVSDPRFGADRSSPITRYRSLRRCAIAWPRNPLDPVMSMVG